MGSTRTGGGGGSSRLPYQTYYSDPGGIHGAYSGDYAARFQTPPAADGRSSIGYYSTFDGSPDGFFDNAYPNGAHQYGSHGTWSRPPYVHPHQRPYTGPSASMPRPGMVPPHAGMPGTMPHSGPLHFPGSVPFSGTTGRAQREPGPQFMPHQPGHQAGHPDLGPEGQRSSTSSPRRPQFSQPFPQQQGPPEDSAGSFLYLDSESEDDRLVILTHMTTECADRSAVHDVQRCPCYHAPTACRRPVYMNKAGRFNYSPIMYRFFFIC